MPNNADNQYSGGIAFHSPQLVLGAANGTTLGGGFQFDLPLATVAAMTNDALNFTGNANSAAQAQFSATYAKAGKDYLDTQAGAADIAKFSMGKTEALQQLVMNNPNAVKPFTMGDLADWRQTPGALPALSQPKDLGYWQLENNKYTQQQQQQQQQAASGGGGGINWGSIIGTVASFFL